MNTSKIYDLLPLSEKTLLKRIGSYPFRISNDRGATSDWYIYDDKGDPCAVVLYRGGRKLTMHGYTEAE